MAEFIKAFNITVAIEGGYSNNPADKGGETYKGISRVYFPDWSGWSIVDALQPVPSILVETFYKKNFWDKQSLDVLSNQIMANEIFDCSVNMSLLVCGQFFQRALNVLNLDEHRREVFIPLTVDGIIGTKTLTAYHFISEERQDACYKLFKCLRGNKYISICENDSAQKIFMLGWANRV